ncbi:MAG: response regulator transcription factor [Acidimicrobiales bacterium]
MTRPDATAPTGHDVLVVDDEPQVLAVVAEYLEREGYRVRTAADGDAALAELAAKRPDLVLLDLMLPGTDGWTILDRLRSAGDEVPVIVLSARGAESERVAGLELGADDYLPKPASAREVVARVRAVLRRSTPTGGATTLTVGPHEIDVSGRRVQRGRTEVELPPKEFDLLVRLASTPGQVHSRADLLRDVWGSSPDWQDPSTVTVHVKRLRSKFEADPSDPKHFVTVYGVGYRFDP